MDRAALGKSVDAFDIDRPAISPQQHVDAPATVAHPGLADAFDAMLEVGLVAALRLVDVKCTINLEGRAGTPDRYLPVTAQQLVDKFALAARLQSFFERTSCSIALSKDRSATIRFNFAFSSSS
jgi:hypothetical protein